MRVKGLPPNMKDLELLLRNLDFANNFGAAELDVEVPAGSEIAIANPLRGLSGQRELPAQFALLDVRRKANVSGTISISRGNVPWTQDILTFRNDGTATALIVVKLFRGI